MPVEVQPIKIGDGARSEGTRLSEPFKHGAFFSSRKRGTFLFFFFNLRGRLSLTHPSIQHQHLLPSYSFISTHAYLNFLFLNAKPPSPVIDWPSHPRHVTSHPPRLSLLMQSRRAVMPRTGLPPTPAASTEIPGKVASPISASENPFNLPPPAIETHRNNGASTVPSQGQSASSPGFSLPPPPTRSRTIIQMKPKPQSSEDSVRTSMQQGAKVSNKKTSASSSASATAGKKQPSSTSVAGKKIARKTAHSVIERRRRSKMNEEFGTLKAMIPACTDQEMHKLAILQVRDTSTRDYPSLLTV